VDLAEVWGLQGEVIKSGGNMSDRLNQLCHVMTKQPITVSSNILLRDALEIMRAWGVRHLPVTSNGKTLGLLSERDIYKQVALGNHEHLTVGDAMSSAPFIVKAQNQLSKVVRIMAENKFGCAIVENPEGDVCGIFTTTDALYVLSWMLQENEESEFYAMSVEEYLNFHQPKAAV
jgi:predicted transcriptional regulator